MATTKAATISVLVTSTSVPCPTDPDDQCVFTNLGSTTVWVQHIEGAAAALSGENCEAVPSGKSTYLMWRPASHPYTAIADTGTCVCNIVNRMGR